MFLYNSTVFFFDFPSIFFSSDSHLCQYANCLNVYKCNVMFFLCNSGIIISFHSLHSVQSITTTMCKYIYHECTPFLLFLFSFCLFLFHFLYDSVCLNVSKHRFWCMLRLFHLGETEIDSANIEIV